VTAGTLNPQLRDIADEFTALHGERLQLLLEYAEQLPPPARPVRRTP
jgi:sulfur transfer protein SufE